MVSATLFVFFSSFFPQYIHSHRHSYIHLLRVRSCFFIALRSVEGIPGVPSRDSNIQHADALLTEICRILWATPHPTEVHRTLLSYAAPFWATELMSLPFSKTNWATPHPQCCSIFCPVVALFCRSYIQNMPYFNPHQPQETFSLLFAIYLIFAFVLFLILQIWLLIEPESNLLNDL